MPPASTTRSREAHLTLLCLLTASLVLATGCSGQPAAAPAAGAAVPPEPSAGCHAGTLPPSRADRQQRGASSEVRESLLDAPGGPADRPRPVVLVFHGFRSDAVNLRAAAGWVALAEREGVIVVHPDGHEGVRLLGTVGRGWDFAPGETRDRDLVADVLDRLEFDRCVDRRRVFATGMSNGGLFANLLGCELAARLAAIAPVAGARALPGCTPARPVPVLLVHGRADTVIDPLLVRGARDWWAATNGCGAPDRADGCERLRGCTADVVYCEGEHGHTWPPEATARIWEFFRAHPRPVA